jgi:hypothetical protein
MFANPPYSLLDPTNLEGLIRPPHLGVPIRATTEFTLEDAKLALIPVVPLLLRVPLLAECIEMLLWIHDLKSPSRHAPRTPLPRMRYNASQPRRYVIPHTT